MKKHPTEHTKGRNKKVGVLSYHDDDEGDGVSIESETKRQSLKNRRKKKIM